MSDRFTARRLGARRHRLLRLAIGVLVVAVVGAAVWLVFFSSVLDVRTVAVKGETSLSRQQVRKAAAVPLGGPLARVDLTAIEARVKANPRVRTADVSRSWPHGVTIEIEERTAVVWATFDGEIRGIDRYGVDFRSYRREPKQLIEARISGTDPDARLQTLGAVASIADLIRREDPALRRQVQAIEGSTKDSVTLDLSKGRTVTWGSVAQGSRKLEVLDTLLDLDARGYDVSAPDQPTTRG